MRREGIGLETTSILPRYIHVDYTSIARYEPSCMCSLSPSAANTVTHLGGFRPVDHAVRST